ncbi:putative gustatory receptor 2a isoform X2 [Aedes albopictus]|uniref:Gustatory receptor n=1 Tax=Aedes albopictus TaxID=7160 RepID=A0ABM1YIT4_AEDAL
MFQNQFMSLGTQTSYTKERNFVVMVIVSAVVGSIISFSVYFLYDDEMDWEYFFETVHFNLLFTMTCIYGVSVSYLIHRRLYLTNETISKHFPSTIPLDVAKLPEKVSSVTSSEDQREALIKIKFIVDQLKDTISLVNQCFSLQVLYCVGVSFVIGIVCSFYLFRAVIYRNDQLVMGVVNFVWYMYYISFVLFFIAIGSRISHEGQRIGITVHKAINFCNTSRTVINELIIFSQQLLHHIPVITCGLFVYDWSLLYTMLGATATYLIILIQFDVSFPSLDAIGNLTSQE